MTTTCATGSARMELTVELLPMPVFPARMQVERSAQRALHSGPGLAFHMRWRAPCWHSVYSGKLWELAVPGKSQSDEILLGRILLAQYVDTHHNNPTSVLALCNKRGVEGHEHGKGGAEIAAYPEAGL